MANYFKQLPNFEYVSRLPDSKISDFIEVKNLFKRGLLREDIFQNLAFFTKYKIRNNDRPDNVAFDFYEDSNLDWLVLVCNNIINIQTEWPMDQNDLDAYLLDKYGNYESLYSGIHHYETTEVRDNQNIVIVPEGLQVESDYQITFYDNDLETQVTKTPVKSVTNYEYENLIEDNKRNIFLLKPEYINVVKDDMEEIMTYRKGSTQYMSGTLKKGDNIRLYQ
tara:strand:+ start:3484 stop:4149 length:666 start_codon:yes stop_codon:yes gene_type:complete